MSIDLMRDKPTVGVPIGQGTNGSGAQLQPVNPAYNTYVGARYVPIFAGDWDATKTYEPLTIVMWQGNSYTSKTFVPAQTEIGNEDFWALTGNYNAQVEVYRQEVENALNQFKSFSGYFEETKLAFTSETEWGVSAVINGGVSIVIDFSGSRPSNAVNALNKLNVTHIDFGFISHYHQDHVLGLVGGFYDSFINSETTFFLPAKPPQAFIDADASLETNYNNVISKLTALNAKILPVVETVEIGNYKVELFNLNPSYYAGLSKLDYNNCSILIRLEKDNNSLLYTGDSTYITWDHIGNVIPQSNILTAPHHGGSACYPQTFINAIRPVQAVSLSPTNNREYSLCGTFNSVCALNGISNVFTFSYSNNTYLMKFNGVGFKRNILISNSAGVVDSWPALFSSATFKEVLQSFNNNTTFRLELSPSELTRELVADGNLGTQIYYLEGHKNSHGSVKASLFNMSRLSHTDLWINSTNEYFASGETIIGFKEENVLEYISNKNFVAWNENIATFRFPISSDAFISCFISMYNPSAEVTSGTLKMGSHTVGYSLQPNSYGGCFDLSLPANNITFDFGRISIPKIYVKVQPRKTMF